MKTSLFRHDRTRESITRHHARLGATTLWLLIVGLIARVGTGSAVQAATVTLAWDPPTNNVDSTPPTDLAGYKVYYGTSSRVYATVIDAGPVTTVTVTNLPTGETYFFASTCYNTSGNESAFSEEMAWTPPLSSPLDHFAWGPISSPQTSGVPFNVTVTAKDTNNVTVVAFVGTVRLSSTVAITPTKSRGFVNGVWTGSVTVLAETTNLALTASDGQGHSGSSTAFRTDVRLKSKPHRPTLSASMTETGLVVSWSSVMGAYYTVQRSTNLMAVPAFTNVVSHVAGQDPITAYTDTAATGSGPYYYRVQVEP